MKSKPNRTLLTAAEFRVVSAYKLYEHTTLCEICGAEFVTKLQSRTLCGGDRCANDQLMKAGELYPVDPCEI